MISPTHIPPHTEQLNWEKIWDHLEKSWSALFKRKQFSSFMPRCIAFAKLFQKFNFAEIFICFSHKLFSSPHTPLMLLMEWVYVYVYGTLRSWCWNFPRFHHRIFFNAPPAFLAPVDLNVPTHRVNELLPLFFHSQMLTARSRYLNHHPKYYTPLRIIYYIGTLFFREFRVLLYWKGWTWFES